jgi:molybdenum cofactor synthesis domain-containing protein
MAPPRLKGFRQTTKVETALTMFFDNVTLRRLSPELVSLDEALGRISAEDIVSKNNVPSYDRAAMDGYAVVAADTFGASQTAPALLSIVCRGDMKKPHGSRFDTGKAVEINTGEVLPAGADAVVMLEYVRKINEKQIEVLAPVTPNENVSKAGEDIPIGDLVLRQGTRLKPPDVAMLAALSTGMIQVVRRPKIAIVCTGNELVELSEPVDHGKIVNTNRFLLSALIQQLGASPIYLGIARDSIEDIARLIRIGLTGADVLLVTGGTSVGARDLVPEAINSVGKPGMIVHGISIRPGMPTGLASVDRKPVVSLPGQPVAAMIGFEMLVRPLILCLLGTEDEPKASVKAKMSRRVASAVGMRTFLRVNTRETDGTYFADPITTAGSGILSSMTRANGIVVIPEDKEGIEVDEEVTVMLFRPVGRTKND